MAGKAADEPPARDELVARHLERLFLRIARTAGAPAPEVNVAICGRRRDFVFRRSRLVVEVDGYAFHSCRQAMARDRRRDRELTAGGWRPVRFTYEDVALEPRRVAAELTELIETGPAGGMTVGTTRSTPWWVARLSRGPGRGGGEARGPPCPRDRRR